MTLRTINRKQLTGVTGGFDFSPLLRRKGQSQADAKQKVQSSLSQVMSGAISGGGADTPKKK
jgi:hypothetical protein